MCRDSIEQLLVEMEQARPVTVALRGNQRLKRFQCLNGSLEADGSRQFPPSRDVVHERRGEQSSERRPPDRNDRR